MRRLLPQFFKNLRTRFFQPLDFSFGISGHDLCPFEYTFYHSESSRLEKRLIWQPTQPLGRAKAFDVFSLTTGLVPCSTGLPTSEGLSASMTPGAILCDQNIGLDGWCLKHPYDVGRQQLVRNRARHKDQRKCRNQK